MEKHTFAGSAAGVSLDAGDAAAVVTGAAGFALGAFATDAAGLAAVLATGVGVGVASFYKQFIIIK